MSAHAAKGRELPLPSLSVQDDRSREALRAWAGPGGFEVVLDVGVWDRPGAWGIALCDIARNVADAVAGDDDALRDEILGDIREVFDAEWDRPTDWPRDPLDG